MGEKSGWTAQVFGRQVRRQRVLYGAGDEVAFQPGGDAGGQVLRVGG
jgi:hypothetical protein